MALQSSNEACRLSVLSSFGHLVVACAQHPQPASRKLSVKLVEAWLEFVNGIATPGSTSLSNSSSTDTGPKIGKTSAESSVRILATIAVEDSDAGVQVSCVLRFSPFEFNYVYRALKIAIMASRNSR